MDVRVTGRGPSEPFLGARDLFATEYDLDLPVVVKIRENPDERTMAGHYDDRHELIVSRRAATSAMARELALHEFAHMARYEEAHPSHRQSTEEALFLALAGRSVERRKLSHCYQIANHMKDIYADDITLDIGPTEKLVAFMESSLARALADSPPSAPGGWQRRTDAADPEITAVNAAFALALLERHGAIEDGHRLYDLAAAAAADAPDVSLSRFKQHFRSLGADPDESEYRKALVDVTREYAVGRERAAD
ncbi:hypothetical protein KM295_10750 [Natronomonas sp. F2-12]|jgi:hypothetical protein|uniref:Uncharacterized protein n=1 Tax=Natronomonas aquatica TaxID=2841590 RepID=A0A9R1D729_9EURY|nr:DUF5781 family protein [Natronomonas aquatica]MCQ4333952.1 hypothetical protein [Natronomonas aquatica]